MFAVTVALTVAPVLVARMVNPPVTMHSHLLLGQVI
jgi:hypothetical protein